MKPSSARWAVWARAEPASAGVVPRTMTRPLLPQPRHGGVEEALQLDQLGRVGDPGGVEDERLRLALGAGAFGADVVEQRLQRALQAAAGGGAAEHRPGDHRRAGQVAVEVDRLGEADLRATVETTGALTICE